jgi:hypothetical protein
MHERSSICGDVHWIGEGAPPAQADSQLCDTDGMAEKRRSVNDMIADAKTRIEELSVDQLKAELAAGEVTLVDIRDIRERVERGGIPGAVSAPRGMLEFWFDPESPYYKGYQFESRYVLY